MANTKPLIGVTTGSRTIDIKWWCLKLSVLLAKGKPLRLTHKHFSNFKQCHAFVISGGTDINPKCYGQPNLASYNIDNKRDAMEQAIIKHAIKEKKSLMGICRGTQMINVVKKGTLYQNARDFYKDFVPTNSLIGKIFFRKEITFSEKGILLDLFNHQRNLTVNSLHHQAILKLGDGLKIVAKDKHGMVQAIEGTKTHKQCIFGVQWHPELMLYKKAQRQLFKTLINAANNRLNPAS